MNEDKLEDLFAEEPEAQEASAEDGAVADTPREAYEGSLADLFGAVEDPLDPEQLEAEEPDRFDRPSEQSGAPAEIDSALAELVEKRDKNEPGFAIQVEEELDKILAAPLAPAAEEPELEVPQDDEDTGAAHEARRAEWASHMERLWPSVEQMLRISGAATNLDPIRKSLQLTQDLEVDENQREMLLEALRPEIAIVGGKDIFRSREDIEPVSRFFYDETLGISVLGDLWRDPDVTEIMVDSWDRVVVEKEGRLIPTERTFRSPEHAASVARSLALRVSDRAVSNAIPLVTAELPRARVAIAYGPVVKGGLSITIRKFRDLLGLDDLIRLDALDESMAEFLSEAVRARATILVSGGTGSGKTTIVNLLSAFIPEDERVITIEDAFELQLSNAHVVSLQTKEAASSDDTVSVRLADLLRATLRMRPDRIVVGEIREPEAAEVMLAAANTGHAGTMTTIHANSTDSAFNERLTDLLNQARGSSNAPVARTIASAFDIGVQVQRAPDGSRYVSEIVAVSPVVRDGNVSTEMLFSGSGVRAKRSFERHEAAGSAARRIDKLVAEGRHW